METKFCVFGKITLPFTGVVKSCSCQEFLKLQIYLLMLFAKRKLSHFFYNLQQFKDYVSTNINKDIEDVFVFLFVCLIRFFTSHQHFFS